MPSVDIRVFGNKELDRKLGKIADKTQKTIVRGALRKEAKKTQARIASNIQRLDLIDSGMMLQAFQATKIKSAARKGFIRVGPELPSREALGIDPGDKYYYPYAVEFGHVGADAKPFIRPAVDENKDESLRSIGTDIGKGIERQARKR